MESLAILDSAIDFPEEGEDYNIDAIVKNLKKLIQTAENAIEFSHTCQQTYNGQDVIIFGPPNSGKSSFYNLLCQENRAITSSIKGTTRDRNTTQLEIFGQKATITDTAGLRKTNNLIEKKGVNKTLQILDTSKNFILVLSPDSFSVKNCKFIEDSIDKMKTSADEVPAIFVGGGTIINKENVKGISKLIIPDNFAVANAVGAAVGQVSGEVDRVFHYYKAKFILYYLVKILL